MQLDRDALRRAHDATRRQCEASAEADSAMIDAVRSANDFADGVLDVAGVFANTDDLRGQFAAWLKFRARLRMTSVGGVITDLIAKRDQRFRDLALVAWGFDPCR